MKKNILLAFFTSIFSIGSCIGQNPFTKVKDVDSNYSSTNFKGANSLGDGFSSNWDEVSLDGATYSGISSTLTSLDRHFTIYTEFLR